MCLRTSGNYFSQDLQITVFFNNEQTTCCEPQRIRKTKAKSFFQICLSPNNCLYMDTIIKRLTRLEYTKGRNDMCMSKWWLLKGHNSGEQLLEEVFYQAFIKPGLQIIQVALVESVQAHQVINCQGLKSQVQWSKTYKYLTHCLSLPDSSQQSFTTLYSINKQCTMCRNRNGFQTVSM